MARKSRSRYSSRSLSRSSSTNNTKRKSKHKSKHRSKSASKSRIRTVQRKNESSNEKDTNMPKLRTDWTRAGSSFRTFKKNSSSDPRHNQNSHTKSNVDEMSNDKDGDDDLFSKSSITDNSNYSMSNEINDRDELMIVLKSSKVKYKSKKKESDSHRSRATGGKEKKDERKRKKQEEGKQKRDRELRKFKEEKKGRREKEREEEVEKRKQKQKRKMREEENKIKRQNEHRERKEEKRKNEKLRRGREEERRHQEKKRRKRKEELRSISRKRIHDLENRHEKKESHRRSKKSRKKNRLSVEDPDTFDSSDSDSLVSSNSSFSIRSRSSSYDVGSERKRRRKKQSSKQLLMLKDMKRKSDMYSTTRHSSLVDTETSMSYNKKIPSVPKTKMRTFSSVTKGLGMQQKSYDDTLLLSTEDRKDGSARYKNKMNSHHDYDSDSSNSLHVQHDNTIDFLSGLEQYAKLNGLPFPQSFRNKSLKARSLLQRQRELNQIIKEEPTNTDAWSELASLSHHSSVLEAMVNNSNDDTQNIRKGYQQRHKNRGIVAMARKSDLERKKSILMAAKDHNIENVDIRCDLIYCRMELGEDHEIIQEELFDAIHQIHHNAKSLEGCNSNNQYHDNTSTFSTFQNESFQDGPIPLTFSSDQINPSQAYADNSLGLTTRNHSKPSEHTYTNNILPEFPYSAEAKTVNMRKPSYFSIQEYNSKMSQLSRSLLRLHRMHLRYISQSATQFNAEKIRRCYLEGFQSIFALYENRGSDSNDVSNIKSDGIGPESSFLLLDYLRLESSMGYAERAVGILQSVLELNLNVHHLDIHCKGDKVDSKKWQEKWMDSFRDFWDCEAPRIGDSFPEYGWMRWESNNFRRANRGLQCEKEDKSKQKEYVRRKRKIRLKASDFFDEDESYADVKNKPIVKEETETNNTEKALNETCTEPECVSHTIFKPEIALSESKLIEAYEIAVELSFTVENDSSSSECVDNNLDSSLISQTQKIANDLARKEQSTNSKESDSINFDQNTEGERPSVDSINTEGKRKSNAGPLTSSNTAVNHLFLQGQGDLVPSSLAGNREKDNRNKMKVYSFVHKRTIEISKDEISENYAKGALRRALRNLQMKRRKDGNVDEILSGETATRNFESRTQLDFILDDDPFVIWGANERKLCSTQNCLFRPPSKSTCSPDSVNEDPNRAILFEDGIDDMILPYMANFDRNQGLPSLVKICLDFLGVHFPRSFAHDEFCQNTHHIAPNLTGLEAFADALNSNSISNSEKGWDDVLDQIILDESFVSFDHVLWRPDNNLQLNFVRKVLYAISSSLQFQNAKWNNFILSALILFEASATKGDEFHVEEVIKTILSKIDAAKDDPLLWMVFAQAIQICSKDNSSSLVPKPLKYVLATLEAAGVSEFQGKNKKGWLELSLLAVTGILGLDFNNNREQLVSPMVPALKENALNILFCAIDGDFTIVKRMDKNAAHLKNYCNRNDVSSSSYLISSTKVAKSKAKLETLLFKSLEDLDSVHVESTVADYFFDATHTLYFYVMLASWLEIISGSVGDKLNFSAGIFVIKEWMKKIALSRKAKSWIARSCLIRLANAMLKFTILSQERKNASSKEILQNVLIPTVAILKHNGCVPSDSILLAISISESTVENHLLKNDYFSLLRAQGYDCSIKEALYFTTRAICDTRLGGKYNNKNHSVDSLNDPETSLIQYSKLVQEAIKQILSLFRHSSYPFLWCSLIRLELISGIHLCQKNVCNANAAFIAARSYYEQGLARCMYSKDLWLDAFQLLRPAFSREELMMQMATLDETELRLFKGLEGGE